MGLKAPRPAMRVRFSRLRRARSSDSMAMSRASQGSCLISSRCARQPIRRSLWSVASIAESEDVVIVVSLVLMEPVVGGQGVRAHVHGGPLVGGDGHREGRRQAGLVAEPIERVVDGVQVGLVVADDL